MDNLLPGSPPRPVYAETDEAGGTIRLHFNKKIITSDSLSRYFSIQCIYDSTFMIPVTAVVPDPSDTSSIILVTGMPLFREYAVSLDLTGKVLAASDGGVAEPFFSFPVTNNSPPAPPTIISTTIQENGLLFFVECDRDLLDADNIIGDFNLEVNGYPYPINSIIMNNRKLVFYMEIPLRSGDELLLSYTGTRLFSTDSVAMKPFSDLLLENNLVPPVFQAIPGQIEAESFITSARTRTETGPAEEGTVIGSIGSGSYLDYAVHVANTGVYTLAVRIASPVEASVRLLTPGPDPVPIDTIRIPSTGSSAAWETIYSLAQLEEGEQYLRVEAITGGFKFNRMTFDAGETWPLPMVLGAELDTSRNIILIQFDKPLVTPPENEKEQFNVLADLVELTIDSVTVPEKNPSSLAVYLDQEIPAGAEKVTVSYHGHYLIAFDNTPVPDFADLEVMLPTSADDALVPDPETIVFPNPAIGNITFRTNIPYRRIQIISGSGRVMRSFQFSVSQQEMTLKTDLPAGNYFLILQGERYHSKTAFIVE